MALSAADANSQIVTMQAAAQRANVTAQAQPAAATLNSELSLVIALVEDILDFLLELADALL